jgi:hypothetical protein
VGPGKPYLTRIFALAGAAVMLAACTYDPNKEPDPNIFPTGYKNEILITLQQTLEDPTNVKNAFISEPVLMPVATSQSLRYVVCVRSNSRDQMHLAYLGIKDRIAYFYAGHLTQLIDATPEQCGKAAYQPWPELEKVCLSDKNDCK